MMDARAPVMAPGCGDALSARLIEVSGFEAAYMSGAWTAASRGFQDYGILTLNEMVATAHDIAMAVDMPIVADADSGFGSHLNVRRCVKEFERAGVAAIHLEDQELPKKCGLIPGKIVIPADEMELRIATAAAAKQDPDFIIIVKTDALSLEGLEATLQRGRGYFAAGADMLFVEALQSDEQAALVAQEFKGKYLLYSSAAEGYGPQVTLEQVGRWGYQLIKYPMHLLLAGLPVQSELLKELRQTGDCRSFARQMMNLHDLFEVIGNVEPHAKHDEPALTA
jgi:2-methylisocitrate lyase-like PEP mutase family enzyme